MSIRVLGCSGAIAAGSRTTSFLLDGTVLIDAGTGVGDLDLLALSRIDDIVLSHSHLDHIVSIALLADSVMRVREGRPPIRVRGLPATLQALREHIFNGVIWPDFTRLPSADKPILELVPFETGDMLQVGGRRIEVLPAAHTVPAVGFAVEGAAGWWVFTGDTGPNAALWKRLAQLKVSHLIIETAFSDEEKQLARISRHLCPAALGFELQFLDGPLNDKVDVYITHIKPGETAAVMEQIGSLGTRHRIRALETGSEMSLG